MVETKQCGFCRREHPKDAPECGPKDGQPCACCGLVIIAQAPRIHSEDAPSDSDDE